MNKIQLAEDIKRLKEQIVKESLAQLDWNILKAHLEEIELSSSNTTELCGHIRRYTDLICKYPRKDYEQNRTHFFGELISYILKNCGIEARNEVANEILLIESIERGYRNILQSLSKCDISLKTATVRVAATIYRACQEYKIFVDRFNKMVSEMKQFDLISSIRLHDDDGNSNSLDAILEGLSESVSMTLIMEAYKNSWFNGDIVNLPQLSKVTEKEIYQAGSTQLLALIWRQWQRIEKRRRFLGGEFRIYKGDEIPSDIDNRIKELIEYIPPENGYSEREVYDYFANARLKDRLEQTYVEMETEYRLSEQGVGIEKGAALPPHQFTSLKEIHAVILLSETLGYPIAHDNERLAGLRLVEWIRGYDVLREIAQSRTMATTITADEYAIQISETELIGILQMCGLEGELALKFIEYTSLHKSSRDMFDCPLVRLEGSSYLLMAPFVLSLNIAQVVLSNLSNRGEDLGQKGKAFEHSIHEFFRKQKMEVFAFKVNRNGQEFEYDAVVPWDGYLFVFECKNRSLSGNDPVQTYYFDLEILSQVKQVKRLIKALVDYPDIIEQEMGGQYIGMKLVPCVLHSLPYSRLGNLDGIYFTDASSLFRFFDQPYFNIKVPHRIGQSTLLHRVAIKRLWIKDKPSAVDFLNQLEESIQLELSSKHMDQSFIVVPLSETVIAETREIIRKERTVRSVCEMMEVDADFVLKEIETVSNKAAELRTKLKSN